MVDLIKFLCNKKGITVSALGVELGLGKNSITRWDENKPSVDRVQKVADYFGVSVDYLLGRTDDPRIDKNDSDIKDNYMIVDGKKRSCPTKKSNSLKKCLKLSILIFLIDCFINRNFVFICWTSSIA